MAKCIHHIDADGLCAAAIIKNELIDDFAQVVEEDFIPYNHGWKLELPEIKEGEVVYFVDLALDGVTFNAMKQCIDAGAHVVHIDHHKSGSAFYETLSPEGKATYDQVRRFFRTDYSGTMLTWIYACMTEDERKDPANVQWDIASGLTHVGFWLNTPNKRETAIPLAVRLIDDNDVWRHSLEESKYFALTFKSIEPEEKKPLNLQFWKELLYAAIPKKTLEMIDRGRMLYDYQMSIYKCVVKNGFEYEIGGIKSFVVNCPFGNSELFGDKYDEYPMVCKYSYDGQIKKWRYTFYSNCKDPNVDCGEIARLFFAGGGHQGSAGGMLEYNYFED
jgi:oligoribonuclease NrnB/cAMP/cGMP phosphodiesterase (DHH superfamily)